MTNEEIDICLEAGLQALKEVQRLLQQSRKDMQRYFPQSPNMENIARDIFLEDLAGQLAWIRAESKKAPPADLLLWLTEQERVYMDLLTRCQMTPKGEGRGEDL